MRKLPFLFFLCGIACSETTFAQYFDLPKFGEYSVEEKKLKECSFEKDAEAVVLLDDAFADWDGPGWLVTKRRIRIKILNERGLDHANIRIRFYSKDNFELIRNVVAVTANINENGDAVTWSVDKKSIFTEKENAFYSSIKFAMPNVKPGSIIEYKYESVMENYGGLRSWEFQSELPTLRSCFLLHILPNAEFHYLVQKKKFYPITVKPMPDEGQVYFEMNEIPGLKFEPYMDAPKDYLQRVEFQFSGYLNAMGSKLNVNTTWQDAAGNLADDKELGGALKKDLPGQDEIKVLVAKETSETGKMTAIYNYVRNNFTWNGFYGKYAEDGLKKIWENKTGDVAEINLVLASLLRSFDIEAYPMLAADRDYGKVDPDYPLIDRFDKTITYAVADGRSFVLDATEKYNPPGLTPYDLLNTYAFVIDKKKFKLVQLLSGGRTYKNIVAVNAAVNENGVMTGTTVITSYEYAKQVRTEKLKKSEKNFLKEFFLETHPGLGIDSFRCENIDNDAEPMIQHFKFNHDLNESGGFAFLNSNLFTGLAKNPFTSDERFTNVNFGYPYDVNVEEIIELPANSKTDELPKDKTLESSDKSIRISREMKKEGNTIHVTIQFRQNTTLVPYEKYSSLKEFYKTMVAMLNEPVVIKLAK